MRKNKIFQSLKEFAKKYKISQSNMLNEQDQCPLTEQFFNPVLRIRILWIHNTGGKIAAKIKYEMDPKLSTFIKEYRSYLMNIEQS